MISHRWSSTLTGLLELFLIGYMGVVYENVQFTLRQEKYFEDKIITKMKLEYESTGLENFTDFQNSTQFQEQLDQELSIKYVTLQSICIFGASIAKLVASGLIDVSGFWLSRFGMHLGSLIGSVCVYLASPSSSYLLFYGLPLFYVSNVGNLFLYVCMAVIFPGIHRGKYLAVYKYRRGQQ